MLPAADTYEDLRARFAWRIPERYNIGVDVCDRHAADPDMSDRPAVIVAAEDGSAQTHTFADLRRRSNRMASALAARGVQKGDRVGILLPQGLDCAVAHIATMKLGAISVPLFTLFGPEALDYRLRDSGAKALVCDPVGLGKIRPLLPQLERIRAILCTEDTDEPRAEPLEPVLAAAWERPPLADTRADDPALIIYTSGTTGKPKGALHAHRVLLGHLPGVELPHDHFPHPGDVFWTPADWAWIGGLLDVLLPALHHGMPVVAHRARKFEPEAALAVMERHGVTCTFLPPTALKMLRQVPDIPARFPGLRLRTIASGGETLGTELLDWGMAAFGVRINEFYGQTECNVVVANSQRLFPARPGSMGRPVPGHEVAVVDDAGQPVPAGTEGTIAVRRGSPVMFLRYWNDPDATERKFVGEWLLTGDRGRQDADGHLWYIGRADDVITSAGYRIGPGEVEDCLIGHPAVALAGVVGTPDPDRTEVVTAFVVPTEDRRPADAAAADALRAELQAFVRDRLAAHAYPRRVVFVDALPMTATGKIIRAELRAQAATAV